MSDKEPKPILLKCNGAAFRQYTKCTTCPHAKLHEEIRNCSKPTKCTPNLRTMHSTLITRCEPVNERSKV